MRTCGTSPSQRCQRRRPGKDRFRRINRPVRFFADAHDQDCASTVSSWSLCLSRSKGEFAHPPNLHLYSTNDSNIGGQWPGCGKEFARTNECKLRGPQPRSKGVVCPACRKIFTSQDAYDKHCEYFVRSKQRIPTKYPSSALLMERSTIPMI